MQAEELVQQGDIEGALALLKEQIRKAPSDAKLRVFLFQLLSVIGDWERALTQLNVAADLDASTLTMAQVYRPALQSEALRSRIFAGETSPLLFGEPEPWMGLLMESLKAFSTGDSSRAADLAAEAFEGAPATNGSIDGAPFEWIADADSRLGPMLEMIVNGRYFWVPMHRIAILDFEDPTDLRDTVWQPVHVGWANGGEAVALVPSRYPGSENDADPLVKLARKTEWAELGDDRYAGIGQRILSTDQGDYSLLDARDVQLDTMAASDDAAKEAAEAEE